MLKISAIIIGILLHTHIAWAHPVAYADSNSIMMWNSKSMSDWMLTHTFTTKYSLSTRFQRISVNNQDQSYIIPHINFLLKRWNELDSQANVYLSIGEGLQKIHHSYSHGATFSAIEADWESRRFYTSFREELIFNQRKNQQNLSMTRVRAGFAPYLAEFNELNSWFILQIERQNFSKETTITPMIRLFYHNVLTEFGVDQKGEAQLNFMIHF